MNKNLITKKGENKEVPILFGDIFLHLFQIKFGEEKSMSAFDFERSFHNYFTHEKRPHGKYKFGEIESKKSKDFTESLIKYFE